MHCDGYGLSGKVVSAQIVRHQLQPATGMCQRRYYKVITSKELDFCIFLTAESTIDLRNDILNLAGFVVRH